MTKSSTIPEITCRECGAALAAPSGAGRPPKYCDRACRVAFDRRRETRGAELYDLFMALRFQRKAARARGVWTLICRLAMHWHDKDEAERQGCRSYRPLSESVDSTLWAQAKTVFRPR